LGKELANVVWRLHRARDRIAKVLISGKMNGAVGNYNAHIGRLPGGRLGIVSHAVSSRELGVEFNPYTIQIEPHDAMAELFDAYARANTITHRSRARYLGLHFAGLFQTAHQGGEIGSSTMAA
jgi:adenylosuccinate lyase